MAADTGPALVHITETRAECEPLNDADCLLPWPRARYLAADAATATGWRVAIPQAAIPSNVYDAAIDACDYNHFDGFSAITTAMTSLLGEVDPAPRV